jgi:hypothetical protein
MFRSTWVYVCYVPQEVGQFRSVGEPVKVIGQVVPVANLLKLPDCLACTNHP